MKFEIYEVKRKKGDNVRVYGHPDVFDKIKSVKSYNKPKKALKSAKTLHSIAYFNPKNSTFLINPLKKDYRKSTISLEKLEEAHKDKIQSTINYFEKQNIKEQPLKIEQITSKYTNKSIVQSKTTYKESETLTDRQKLIELEGKIIKESINYYLEKLDLKPLKLINNYNSTTVYAFSTRGDLELSLQLNELPDIEKRYFIQNSVMLNTMIRLGFREIIGCNTHLIGTLFETIYYIACVQENDEVKRKLYKALTGIDIKKLTISNPN